MIGIPLAPEIKVRKKKVPKLIPNLEDKTNYVIHYQNLKQISLAWNEIGENP